MYRCNYAAELSAKRVILEQCRRDQRKVEDCITEISRQERATAFSSRLSREEASSSLRSIEFEKQRYQSTLSELKAKDSALCQEIARLTYEQGVDGNRNRK